VFQELWNFQKSSGVKQQGQGLSYLIYIGINDLYQRLSNHAFGVKMTPPQGHSITFIYKFKGTMP